MLVVSAPVLHLRLGFADASNDPASSTTYKAYEMLAEGFGPGFNGPLFLVAQTGSAADRAALTGSTARSPPSRGWPPCRPGLRKPGHPPTRRPR
jgi:uncharacterized membrane protein YdfJ with MMPL/SSD domain